MQKQIAEKLVEKYLEGTASPDEKAWVETWYLQGQHNGYIFSHDQLLEDEAKSLKQLLKEIHGNKKVKLWPRFAAAASIVIAVSVGLYFYTNNYGNTKQHDTALSQFKNKDFPSGNNAATLTLGNGKVIVLNNASKGILAEESGVSISKTTDGSVVYNIKKTTNEEAVYNSLSTANGQQYQLTLPDLTKVWLNAASSIKFPATFAGLDKREVEINGEAYFEVSKDKNHPFIVKTSTQRVEVLGTHFNINSYADEATVKTTLLEGSVKVSLTNSSLSAASDEAILSPGQQSIFQKASKKLSVQQVDPEIETAWKNGFFVFNDAGIKNIMKQVSRWYDVDVVYEDNIEDFKLGGRVARSKNLSVVLKALELTDKIHFKVQGRRITVMK